MKIFRGWWPLLFIVCVVCGELQGPQFLVEPPHRLDFANSTGAHIHCSGSGNPAPEVEWVMSDGSPLQPAGSMRTALSNGTLYFPPFPADRLRRDIHHAAYRCRLNSQLGAILSREVHVRAVIKESYELKVYDEYVISGNSAVLRCQMPSYVSEFVTVTSWVQDGTLMFYPSPEIAGKYVMLSNGDLHISSADAETENYHSYSCRTIHKLTGEVTTSPFPGHVIITEPKGSVQPRIIVEKHSTRRVAQGDEVVMACAAQGWPVPTYRWFKEKHDQLIPIEPSERVEIFGGLMKISKVKVEDRGKYLCWVNNSAGEETVQVSLSILVPLNIHIQPQVQTIDVGREAVFTCSIPEHPSARISWIHDGRGLPPSASHQGKLVIRPVSKADRGMYQCLVTTDGEQVQASAELKLGDASPELLYWFSEQTLQPGPSVSLKCVAAGSPPPRFTWTLDGFPLPDNTRFLVGQYVTIHDDVISHVNISHIKETDGGEYTCTAQNSAGKTSHGARVNVYGPPFIREMPRLTAVAGSDLVVKCPAAGHPLEAITWERDGQLLPLNRRQRVYPNGTLVVEQTQRAEDAGTYTCQATSKQKLSARRDMEVQVIVPPKIMPIQAMTNLLREGMRAAIACQILEGDLPVTFRWEKDGVPLHTGPPTHSSQSPQQTLATATRLDEFSTRLVIEHITSAHSGNYTCVASNVAGTEKFTVPLTVNVAPRWTVEPVDASAAAGQDLSLHCGASGHPEPIITWRKAVGETPGEYKEFLFEPNVSLFPNGSLVFSRISKDSESHYLCEAKNGIGGGVSKLIFLKVNAPAYFPSKNKQVQVVAGEQAHLQCTALGDTPLHISWRNQHHHVINHQIDQRYSIREQILDDGMVSELGILHTYRQDTGILTCFASNTFGQDEMTVQLIVQEVPEMPKNIRINDQQSRSIQLSWSQPYAGNSPISNYIVQYKAGNDPWLSQPQKVVVPGSATSATVQNLRPAKSYHLRIIAENRLGMSEPSQVIQVTTLEEVPSGPPLDIRAEAKSSTELVVTWEPPQRDMWNGNLLGYYVGYQQVNANVTNYVSMSPQQSYNFKTVEMGQHGGGQSVLVGLERYTSYYIIVQAYNSRGPGPASYPVTAITMEDAPSLPPDNVHCHVENSQSIKVTWDPPPMSGRNGIIQGYKVLYIPLQEWYDKEDLASKQTSQLRTTLTGLRKFTNYTISVTAFTSAGDGARSPPIYCHTEEDVPSSPADIKAVVSSANKILISWLPPLHPNGILVGYTFYMSIIEDGREEGTHKRILSPNTEAHETVRLQEAATHQFWLTASTKIGEGESTRVVTILPGEKVPARITSFGKKVITPWKENISLPCHKVGVPQPTTMWRQMGNPLEPSSRKNVTADGTLIISATQHSDSGNYTCTVENGHGKDDITYHVAVKVPPQPPILSIVESHTDSIHLQWTDQGDGGSPILGYVINYKRDSGDWEELQTEAGTMERILGGLWCGTRYQLYITAYNIIGTGLPCDIVNAYTKGTVPVKPKHSQMITVNATVVTVWLDSWGDGGCGILYFVIEYKEHSHSQWRMVANTVQATERVFSVPGLSPSTQYQLKITAHNNAGFAVALYNFTTHSPPGIAVAPELSPPVSHSSDKPFYTNLRVVLPITLSLLVLTALVALIFLIKKNKLNVDSCGSQTGIGDSPSLARLQNKQNKEQQQQQQLSVGAVPSAAILSRGRQPIPPQHYKGAEGNEYMEDICPYATFQLNKPAYSESSYSGNVYSGPYHSVRGSFVYHDIKPNQSDKFKMGHNKEPEYTKVRRKGSKLRDPHSESQESDNLGSTDSEVKKILTLHLPISEYDTRDEGEDMSEEENSDNSPAGESGYQGRGRHHRPGDATSVSSHFAGASVDVSSSSSETSLGGVAGGGGRRSFPSRRGGKGVNGPGGVRRHVRSSSGYSSHNDETTFSISNYPSFNDHIHPPSRFSDDTECETNISQPRRKRQQTGLPGQGKVSRETFQINV